jgi:hypothetical protein
MDLVANQLSGRAMRVLAAGGYATKEFLRDLPKNVDGVARLLVTGNLYELPKPPRPSKPGRRPSTGKLRRPSHTRTVATSTGRLSDFPQCSIINRSTRGTGH